MFTEIGHLLGIGHYGPGYVYEYQTSPNHWSLMSYGFSLPLEELEYKKKEGDPWTTATVPDNWRELGKPSGGEDTDTTPVDEEEVAYAGPWAKDLPMIHENTEGAKPPYFSRGKAMVAINESSMSETAGLTGDSRPYVFQRIKRAWEGLSSDYAAEVRVSWVDWDRDGDPTPGNTPNPQLIKPNVAMMQKVDASSNLRADMDGDGKPDLLNPDENCYRSPATETVTTGFWKNASTGKKYAFSPTLSETTARTSACLDGAAGEMPGTYKVASTSTFLNMRSIITKIADQSIATKTYNNETDYLKELDMRGFGWACDGVFQYRALGGTAECFAYKTGHQIYSMSDLPMEEID